MRSVPSQGMIKQPRAPRAFRGAAVISWLTALVGLTLLGQASRPVRAADKDPGIEFFEKKIRPLLTENCYQCHSTEGGKKKGELLLDSRPGMLKGGESGPAIVPGKPKESLLLKAVGYENDKLQMPPKGKLPDAAIADLEKWIAMGAPDPRDGKVAVERKPINIEEGRKFWAFQPPKRHPVPEVKDQAWPRGDIDRFLMAKLEAKGLKPAGDADRATLLRRVYFDLIGLPPTPEEIDAFVSDKSAHAYEKVVDRLLASPHFGERWGRHWLDVARFAESSGGGRSLLFPDAWRYRDYVIEAFNQDKPYDRFIREQIAGDLLPHSTPERRRDQVTATAFLALGPTNYERQDKQLLEMDVIDEQLDTLGRTFLGMTIGCARCHDHKFDPIPTRDYYAMAGILKSTQTLIHDNVSAWVTQPLPMAPEQEKVVKEHETQVAVLKEKLKLAKDAEKKAGAVTAKGVLKLSDLPGIVLDDSQAKKVGEWTASKFSGNYIGDGYLHDGNADKGKKTLTFVPDFPESGRYEVRLAYVPGTNRANRVPVEILHVDGEHSGHVNLMEAPPIDGRFISLGTFRFEKGMQWFVMISNEDTKGHVVVDAVQFIPEVQAEKKDAAKPSDKPENNKAAEEVKKLEAELKKLTDTGPVRAMAMAVKEAKVEDCHILIRGVLENRGEKAPRGFLQIATPPAPLPETRRGEQKPPVGALPENESGRRELAEWLSSKDNPLTARVMVNRVWHYLFGAGIVRTVDEFGTTGEPPSHPELLDYLALKFIEDGWSSKKLIRTIVLSRAYQMSSSVNPQSAIGNPQSKDPENRLLWKMNRRRLNAEVIRDTILVVSGKLDRSLGGPNIRKGTSSEYGYEFTDTRRSVYTPVFRNRLHELFEVFDFADPNLVVGRRTVSTVPTQALYLMNSPFVMDQAKFAAEAALKQEKLDDAQRLDKAYRLALSRPPLDNERKIALKFLADAGNDPKQRQAAWERVFHALLACVDFRYVN